MALSKEELLKRAIAKTHFLIVDDDRFSRSLIRTTLMQLGAYNIVEESSAITALKTIKTLDVDIILLDQEMPGLTGLEMARLIRAGEEGVKNPHIPIVVITGNTEEHTVKEAKVSGITEYLLKPISPLALERRLAKILLF